MVFSILASVVTIVLMLAYLGVIVVKLQDFALTAVVLIGIGMMLVDLWQSLKSKEDQIDR